MNTHSGAFSNHFHIQAYPTQELIIYSCVLSLIFKHLPRVIQKVSVPLYLVVDDMIWVNDSVKSHALLKHGMDTSLIVTICTFLNQTTALELLSSWMQYWCLILVSEEVSIGKLQLNGKCCIFHKIDHASKLTQMDLTTFSFFL